MDFVEFHLRGASLMAERYEGEYTANGATARFQIEFTRPEAGIGQGKFIANNESKSQSLVEALCLVLEPPSCPPIPPARDPELRFQYTMRSRDAGRDDPDQPGTWSYVQLSFDDDKDGDTEVVMKLSLKEGLGEFRMANPDSGWAVMRRLVRVL